MHWMIQFQRQQCSWYTFKMEKIWARPYLACAGRSFLPYWWHKNMPNVQLAEMGNCCQIPAFTLISNNTDGRAGHSECWEHAKALHRHGAKGVNVLVHGTCTYALWSRPLVPLISVNTFKAGREGPRKTLISSELLSATVTCCTCLLLEVDFSVQWTRPSVQSLTSRVHSLAQL